MQKRKKNICRSNHFPGSYQELVGKAQVIVRRAPYYNILRPITFYQHILIKNTFLVIKGYFSCEHL